MLHAVGGWVSRIGAAVHTINPLPRVRASCYGIPCPSRVLSLRLTLVILVLETLVRPRGEYVGIASVDSAGRLSLKGLSGLSFCGRVETNFDVLVF
jgi:hypothetical protein